MFFTNCWDFVPPILVLIDSKRAGLSRSQTLRILVKLHFSMKLPLEAGYTWPLFSSKVLLVPFI